MRPLWIIKTMKKYIYILSHKLFKKKKNPNPYLVRAYLFTYHRYLPTPSRSHSTRTNEQTNENVKQHRGGQKRRTEGRLIIIGSRRRSILRQPIKRRNENRSRRGRAKKEEEEAKFGVRLTTAINPSIVSFFYFLRPTLDCCR